MIDIIDYINRKLAPDIVRVLRSLTKLVKILGREYISDQRLSLVHKRDKIFLRVFFYIFQKSVNNYRCTRALSFFFDRHDIIAPFKTDLENQGVAYSLTQQTRKINIITEKGFSDCAGLQYMKFPRRKTVANKHF